MLWRQSGNGIAENLGPGLDLVKEIISLFLGKGFGIGETQGFKGGVVAKRAEARGVNHWT